MKKVQVEREKGKELESKVRKSKVGKSKVLATEARRRGESISGDKRDKRREILR